MSEKPNGGPAFPCSNEQFTHGNPQTGDAWSGLSMRDWFAGQALAGATKHEGCQPGPEGMAKRAYALADAMLAAREAK